MTHKVEAEFEFAIGEIVYHKTAAHQQGTYPSKFVVDAQILQISPGGQELYYVLSEKKDMVLEHSLTREKPPYDPVVEQAEEQYAFGGWTTKPKGERLTDEQRKERLARARATVGPQSIPNEESHAEP